ncbi:hypothetical protein ABK040_001912 [Willaertia magna]
MNSSLTKRLGYLNNDGYVDFGNTSSFQINYNIFLQQIELTNSSYLKTFLEEYGNEIKEFYENVKPEEITKIPTKIAPMGSFCTGIRFEHLSQPGKWIFLATSFIYKQLRYSILIHKENKVLFNHWYAKERMASKFTKDLTNTMVKYLLFDHKKKKEEIKEKLRVRMHDFKLIDIDVILLE